MSSEITYRLLRKCSLTLVAADINEGVTEFETQFIEQLERRIIAYICVKQTRRRNASRNPLNKIRSKTARIRNRGDMPGD
jgi:hypothetical protein